MMTKNKVQDMTKIQQAVITITKLAMVLIAGMLVVMSLVDEDYNKYGGIIASLLLPFLPDVLEKLLKTKISFRLQLIYLTFLFVSLFLGIDFDFYKTVPMFDKVTHFVSGALTVLVGYYILKFFQQDKSSRAFRAVFLMCFCMAVAVLWEFFEFACDKLLGQSMQQLISVGVDDTMYDLLMATIGAGVGIVVLFAGEKDKK